ncbi:MAG: ComEC/Rec2 family competence protein, partial [bacterium]
MVECFYTFSISSRTPDLCGGGVYPLDFFTIGYIAGLLAEWAPAPFGLRGAIWLAASSAGLSFAAHRAIRAGAFASSRVPLAFLLIGGGAAGAIVIPAAHKWALPSHHLLLNLPRGKANVIGHLVRPIEERGDSARKRPRMHIEVERLFARGVEIPARGTVRITAAAALRSPLSVGDRLLVWKVKLRPPRRHLNPGDFDYREFLRLRNIHAVAYASPGSVERIVPEERFAWRRWIYSFRTRMQSHIKKTFSPEISGLLEAITLGIREDMGWALRESFRLAGASHILAISGLHVGFISGFFFFAFLAIFRRLPPAVFPTSPVVMTPFKLASLFVIPIVILFALLTGARVSTVRASIMAVVYLASRLFERPGGALHSIFLAAFIILVLQPGFIWDAGFQLSFIAVFAIILAVRRLPRPEPGQTLKEWGWWRKRLLQFAGIQGVVSAVMAPMTAWHFQEIHLAGLLTNFVLIPIASITVPLTFLVTSFSAVADALLNLNFDMLWLPADIFLGFFAQVMIYIARLAASIPAGTINVSPPSPLLIGVFLFSMLLALGMRAAALRKTGWAAVALSMVFILKPLLPAGAAPSGQAMLMVPDAGREDVFFIRLPDGRGYVIDAARKSRS